MSDWPYIHFNRSEFICNCEGLCNKFDGIDRDLVATLDLMREDLGLPLIVNSGLRCPEHNRNVGGSSDSRHLYGLAADISLPKGYTSADMEELAEEYEPFLNGGIGLYDTFIHLDVRGRRARWDGRSVVDEHS